MNIQYTDNQGFPNLQEVARVELGLETFPVSSPDHAAKYLTQMVHQIFYCSLS